MPSKFDNLREGKAIEIRPGLSARLDKDKKRVHLSTGEFFDVGDDPDIFPRNDNELAVSREKEQIQRGIGENPLGEFGYQFSNQGLLGGAKDWIDYATQGKNYAAKKAAQHQVSQQISSESPYMSAAATAAAMIPDIALTKGMSAAYAAPLLAAGHAGSRLISEPMEVAKEAAIGAAGGYALDKAGGYLANVAARRGTNRALPGQQQAVRDANALGQQAVDQTNAQQKQAHELLKRGIKNTNDANLQQHANDLTARQNQIIRNKNLFDAQKAARDAQIAGLKRADEIKLQQHKADLQARQNSMIQAENEYTLKKAANDTEVLRLKNEYQTAKVNQAANKAEAEAAYNKARQAAEAENKALDNQYKLAQKEYKTALDKLPELQRKAQHEYSKHVIQTSKEIEKSFPASSKISSQEIGVDEFIRKNINERGLAASKEGSQATRILKGIFPEGETFGGRALSKKYRGIENAIQNSTPETQRLLNEFKVHLGQSLPTLVEDSVAYTTISPIIKRTIASDVKSVLSSIGLDRSNVSSVNKITNKILQNSKNEIGSVGFVKKLENGEFSRELANKIATFEDFLADFTPHNIEFLKKNGTLPIVLENAKKQHKVFVEQLSQKIQSRISAHELKAMNAAQTSSKRLKEGLANVKQTYGMAEPVAPPTIPSEPAYNPMPTAPSASDFAPISPPNYPPNVPPPLTPPLPSAPTPNSFVPPPVQPLPIPPLPQKPNMLPTPGAPTPQTFTPQMEPTLPGAQSFSDVTGDFLEKDLLGGRGAINNPFAKLAGLKYVLGDAALPLEAAYMGMKGLTSPTAGGELARATFKQGGIQAIDAWAQKYPSYRNGVLENPQERRSLTKEIENDAEIPIEQKAVLQSKVNRGKPLNQRLS